MKKAIYEKNFSSNMDSGLNFSGFSSVALRKNSSQKIQSATNKMLKGMLGIFLDTEANGLDWKIHQMIEISFIIVNLKTGAFLHSYSSLIQIDKSEWEKSNPVSLTFTGLSWNDIQKGKSKATIKKEILEIFAQACISRKSAVFIGQNPSFDRIFLSSLIPIQEQETLNWPYIWLDLASMFFAKEASSSNIEMLELSKDKIAKFYGLPPEEKPHRALRGVEHLIACYEKVVGFKG